MNAIQTQSGLPITRNDSSQLLIPLRVNSELLTEVGHSAGLLSNLSTPSLHAISLTRLTLARLSRMGPTALRSGWRHTPFTRSGHSVQALDNRRCSARTRWIGSSDQTTPWWRHRPLSVQHPPWGIGFTQRCGNRSTSHREHPDFQPQAVAKQPTSG